MRRLRSILYTPGHRPDLIAKAAGAGADAVCLVLEDSVPRDLRKEARTVVADSIGSLADSGATVLVKVNALEPDGLAEDLATIVRPGLAAIVMPKIETSDQVGEVARLLGKREAGSGMNAGSIEIVLMVETPRAVAFAYDLATASARVTALACGAAAGGDLAGALGLVATPDGLERLYVLSKVLVDARAAGIELPLEGVWAGVKDIDGLEAEATRARALGYRGKFAIHPAQVEPINRIFTPTEREVEHATRVLAAFDEGLQRGDAAIVVDGQMIDYAMVTTARNVLKLAASFMPPNSDTN